MTYETEQCIGHRTAVVGCIASALTVALLLFPPWKEIIDIPYHLHNGRALGYAWIWFPPTPSNPRASVVVDWDRVGLEVLALGALGLSVALGIRGVLNKDGSRYTDVLPVEENKRKELR